MFIVCVRERNVGSLFVPCRNLSFRVGSSWELPASVYQTQVGASTGINHRFPVGHEQNLLGLDFKESTFCHITRVLRIAARHGSLPVPLSQHAIFPFTFRLRLAG